VKRIGCSPGRGLMCFMTNPGGGLGNLLGEPGVPVEPPAELGADSRPQMEVVEGSSLTLTGSVDFGGGHFLAESSWGDVGELGFRGFSLADRRSRDRRSVGGEVLCFRDFRSTGGACTGGAAVEGPLGIVVVVGFVYVVVGWFWELWSLRGCRRQTAVCCSLYFFENNWDQQ